MRDEHAGWTSGSPIDGVVEPLAFSRSGAKTQRDDCFWRRKRYGLVRLYCVRGLPCVQFLIFGPRPDRPDLDDVRRRGTLWLLTMRIYVAADGSPNLVLGGCPASGARLASVAATAGMSFSHAPLIVAVMLALVVGLLMGAATAFASPSSSRIPVSSRSPA